MNSPSRLVLGTAQLGIDYGIANNSGIVAMEQARKILDLALVNGVDFIDTAMSYGIAEERLGRLGVSDFKIITKLPSLLSTSVSNIDSWVLEQVEASLHRLRIDRLYGLLLHNTGDLACDGSAQLVRALRRVCNKGLVDHVGVSIYSPDDLDLALNADFVSLLQAPMNVFDRRMVDSGALDILHRSGVEVHLRSVFLQGLLLMKPHTVPAKFSEFSVLFENWHDWCCYHKLKPLEACLSHVQAVAPSAKIVVGCDNAEQFKEILNAINVAPLQAPVHLMSQNIKLINPAGWS